jgi:hypothetical protein
LRIEKRAVVAALVGIAVALPAALYLWAFMVDDGLISARYAAHLASGQGYRFNPGGPPTDGVTPLGWALLLTPFAAGGTLAAFHAAKLIGLCGWLLGAAAMGLAVHRMDGGRLKWAGLTLVLCSAPLGAWSVAGMETGLVLGLAAGVVSARVLGHERLAACGAGLVAALRPETLPWALVLALTPPVVLPPPKGRAAARWIALAMVLAPVLVVGLTRLWAFGRVTPLALLAKPADGVLGSRYAVACLLLTGPIALLAWRKLPPWVRGLQLATGVHFLAIALAGGDWMPLSRLAVPVLPCVVLTACAILGQAHPAIGLPRLGLALAGLIFVFIKVGPVAAAVGQKRMAVIEQLRGPLSQSQVVATLDVGWVGAACNAEVLDLAGVTDPAVAALPGGHTSKRVPHTLLMARNVDTIVLLLSKRRPLADPWTSSWFARLVELEVAQMPAMAQDFTPIAQSEGPLRYVVLRRTDSGR